MGYLGAFRHACAVAALAGLTSCNPPAKQSETAELRAKLAALDGRVAFLEAENNQKSEQLTAMFNWNKAQSDMLGGLDKTISHNAKIANENALSTMTRRGACGTEIVPIYASDGSGRQMGFQTIPIKCTMADLKP